MDSLAEAIRELVVELEGQGLKSAPAKINSLLRTKFGISTSPSYISYVKSHFKNPKKANAMKRDAVERDVYTELTQARCKEDVPHGLHYAIVVYKTVVITYPDYTTDADACEHWVTTERRDWEQKIKELHAQHAKYIAFEVSKVAEVQTQVVVK